MKILVLNAGSSSLKYQLFDMVNDSVIIRGNIERVGVKDSPIKNHTQALNIIVDELITAGHELSTIDGIGHRVVHGGEYFKTPVIINETVIQRITECSDLAPLHNPVNLEVIVACKQLMPEIKQIAVFDTAFHQTMESAHYLYALPMKYYDTYKIRRYGFHGISHQYVYEQLIANYKLRMMNSRQPEKVITCHVGNGVSIAAIKDGKVVETSMGMTPLEGAMMGTRSGNIDPAIITYLINHEHLTSQHIDDILNKQSGLLGISGISADMREILDGCKAQDKRCMLAMDMYLNSIVKYVGAYMVLLGGIDCIVLTAGVMERSAFVREKFMAKLGGLGIVLDSSANDFSTGAHTISASDSSVKVVVIPTNEELMIAQATYGLLSSS